MSSCLGNFSSACTVLMQVAVEKTQVTTCRSIYRSPILCGIGRGPTAEQVLAIAKQQIEQVKNPSYAVGRCPIPYGSHHDRIRAAESPMIKTVATWRCKCGAHIKVVGEVPNDKPQATRKVACPKCGESQSVYAEIILSVSIQQDASERDA